MKVVYLVAIFCLSVANANRDCRLECFQAAHTYRIGKAEKVNNMEEYLMKDCENFAKNLYFKCSKAVPLILENEDIKKTIEAWNADIPSDTATEEAVKKYCRTACRKASVSS